MREKGVKRKKKENIYMKGIWTEKGFEGIDIQKEIKSLRKDLSKSILKKSK